MELFRNIPLLVQIFFFFFALPSAGITLPAFWCGVLALGIYTAAFVAEAIRSGISAVARGQLEAALASGLRYPQAMRLVVLPQAIRLTIPPLGNTRAQPDQEHVAGQRDLDRRYPGRRQLVGARTFAYISCSPARPSSIWFSRCRRRASSTCSSAGWCWCADDLGWLFNPQILAFLGGGLLVTLGLAATSIAISFVLGVVLALGRLSRQPLIRCP